MFGQQPKEEEVKTDPERGEDTFATDDLAYVPSIVAVDPSDTDPNKAGIYVQDSKSLQTIVKSTLEDFYTAIERLKTVTVEIDKVSIGAENWLKSNN